MRSCCSSQKSDVSDALVIWANPSQKNERFVWKIRIFRMFLTVCPLFMPKSESLLWPVDLHSFAFFKRVTWVIHSRRSLQKSDRERFAQVTHDKRATVSDFLRSLMTKEQRERFVFFTGESLFPSFALSLTKNEQIAQKTSTNLSFVIQEGLRNPVGPLKFSPTLQLHYTVTLKSDWCK